MADSLAIATDAKEPTEARFTMRAMFSLTAIVAVGAVGERNSVETFLRARLGE